MAYPGGVRRAGANHAVTSVRGWECSDIPSGGWECSDIPSGGWECSDIPSGGGNAVTFRQGVGMQ